MDFSLLGLLPAHPDVAYSQFHLTEGGILIEASLTAAIAECPSCGCPSSLVHGRYRRRLRDLPCVGRPVLIDLTARKFLCRNPGCERRVFCERLPGYLAAYARTPERLTRLHRDIGLALGGEPGSRLAERLAVPTSPDTLLRRVHFLPDEPAPKPRLVGIDDFALRRGHNYGTILIDLERGRVIDILPGRDGKALSDWLKLNPQVELITRDRWDAYAKACTEAAPQAAQVADRWHLLKNLREALQRFLEGHCELIDQLWSGAGELPPEPPPDEPATVAPPPPEEAAAARQREPTPRQRRRQERFEEVRRLHEQGESLRAIAKRVGISKVTVLRYLHRRECPDWKVGRPRPKSLDRHRAYFDERIAQGCRNAAEVHRELAERGHDLSAATVLRYFNRRLAAAGLSRAGADAAVGPEPPKWSAKRLSFELLKVADRSQPEVDPLVGLIRESAPLGEGVGLADRFGRLCRRESAETLEDWLRDAERSGFKEMANFAAGLRGDYEAVKNATESAHSNGPTEGQVNRLKTIKRQMYGRAGFELLRSRVVHAA